MDARVFALAALALAEMTCTEPINPPERCPAPDMSMPVQSVICVPQEGFAVQRFVVSETVGVLDICAFDVRVLGLLTGEGAGYAGDTFAGLTCIRNVASLRPNDTYDLSLVLNRDSPEEPCAVVRLAPYTPSDAITLIQR